MIHAITKSSRAIISTTIRNRTIHRIRYSVPILSRSIHGEISVPNANQIAIQMVNYALSHARSTKSDESYAQGMLVLEQCLGNHHQSNDDDDDQVSQDSRATVLLAMSDLLYESGNISEAIERLKQVMDLTLSSLSIRVVALEALVGLLLETGQDDDTSLNVVEEFLESVKEKDDKNLEDVNVTAKSIKGFVELVKGNIESAGSLFRGLENRESCKGNVALSYGEFLHANGNFEMAKEMYRKVIQEEVKASMCSCNMNPKAFSLAATFALGQLESHIGNFVDAEETLTKALTIAEEYYGHNHPKVGVILTGIALMYRNKAKMEKSSSILIQEGLYRRALDLMKAPPLDSQGIINMETQEVMALARGGYAELLLIQENRKTEGEKMKSWAESAWRRNRNRRITLSEALTLTEPLGKVAIIDARTTRVV